jgi:hypothetical protein
VARQLSYREQAFEEYRVVDWWWRFVARRRRFFFFPPFFLNVDA